jgi:hypothetical protein
MNFQKTANPGKRHANVVVGSIHEDRVKTGGVPRFDIVTQTVAHKERAPRRDIERADGRKKDFRMWLGVTRLAGNRH